MNLKQSRGEGNYVVIKSEEDGVGMRKAVLDEQHDSGKREGNAINTILMNVREAVGIGKGGVFKSMTFAFYLHDQDTGFLSEAL